ncbi:MAG: hypothetical protein HY287_12665 [Planctomycetes bacterium]|nr:hypothetical protein [Planctomycetota bacterium]MBI3835175.1 hypothetical protein [Planctomycetota bacterium]
MRNSAEKRNFALTAVDMGRTVIRSVSVLGVIAACMGLTQIGPCIGVTPPCATNAECNDDNGCTTDTCNNGNCSHVAACESDHCLNNACVACLADSECDDSDGCTTDACGEDHSCTNVAACDQAHCVSVEGVSVCISCLNDAECDDNLQCTTDACGAIGACTHTPVTGCTERSLATFTDPTSGFSTTDVRDVNDEIVNFDSDDDSIIYKATGEDYQKGQWVVNGNFLDAGQAFEVRFGTVGGEHRAYFTETGSTYICDFAVTPTNFGINPTTTSVPEN